MNLKKMIKSAGFLLMSLLLVVDLSAQKDKRNRPSPPAQVKKTLNGTKVTIDYSRPSKRGREIFGNLEEYGKIWRTGANETSWIELSDEVEVEGKKLGAGKYGLFTIPGKEEWVIIFSKKWDGWGAYAYEEKNDVLRVIVPSQKEGEVVEQFRITISDSGQVELAWDRTKVSFSINSF